MTPGDPGRHYVSLIRGFTIDMGNNPTGNGLSLEGAQLCSIEDIIIKGNFNIGITSLPGSGGSTTNVKVVGGNIGIQQNVYRPTPSIQGVELAQPEEIRHRARRRRAAASSSPDSRSRAAVKRECVSRRATPARTRSATS